MNQWIPQTLLTGTAISVALLLSACSGDQPTPTGRCVLDAESGTPRTRVADCEFPTHDGTRIRMVMIQHVDPELGLLDAEFRGFRIHPDGRVEHMSSDDTSAALANPAFDD